MFPDFFQSRFVFFVILCAFAFQPHPAAAQSVRQEPCGIDLAEDGGRLISAEYSAPCARYYVPYAVMAAAVYLPVSVFETNRAQRTMSDADLALKALGRPDEVTAHAKSLMRGWSYQFGSEGYIQCLHDKDEAYAEDEACKRALPGKVRRFFGSFTGPAFNVWAHKRRRASCSEVSVVFRGTAGGLDFLSNFRRGTDWFADEGYLQLQRNVDAIIARVANLRCYRKETTQVVSVGHSLGAGLAELTAFSQRSNPRIAKVFAFNPSSETGFDLIDRNVLDANVKSNDERAGLEVDIVYHPGEALEQVREVDQQFPLRERCNPLVRTVRFDVNSERGLINQHAIRGTGGFAYGIAKTSFKWDRPLSLPPDVKECPTRYRRPGNFIAVPASDGTVERVAGTSSHTFRRAYAASPDVTVKRRRM